MIHGIVQYIHKPLLQYNIIYMNTYHAFYTKLHYSIISQLQTHRYVTRIQINKYIPQYRCHHRQAATAAAPPGPESGHSSRLLATWGTPAHTPHRLSYIYTHKINQARSHKWRCLHSCMNAGTHARHWTYCHPLVTYVTKK